MKNINKKPKFKPKVVIYSILAFGFIALGILVHWIFIAGAVILMIINQKELFKN